MGRPPLVTPRALPRLLTLLALAVLLAAPVVFGALTTGGR